MEETGDFDVQEFVSHDYHHGISRITNERESQLVTLHSLLLQFFPEEPTVRASLSQEIPEYTDFTTMSMSMTLAVHYVWAQLKSRRIPTTQKEWKVKLTPDPEVSKRIFGTEGQTLPDKIRADIVRYMIYILDQQTREDNDL